MTQDSSFADDGSNGGGRPHPVGGTGITSSDLRAEFARAVRARVVQLQRTTTLTPPVPAAVGTMARLRHAAGQPTGTVADVWDDTIGLVPQRALGHGDDPSPFEQAVHHTMIMFALHRQGRIMTAHVPDVSLGKALRRLSRSRSSDGEDSGAVRRRFDALLTASSPDEGAYHLRGLVRLLRSEDVALDYGRLATDLVDLWTSGRSDRVRLQWARDYRRSERPSEEPTSAAEGTPDP